MFPRLTRLAAALLLCAPLCAQQLAAQPSSQPPTPGLTTNSNLVLVPVVVTNGSGKHVSGLAKSAFQIQENGTPRTVSVFEETTTGELPAVANPPSAGDAAPSPPKPTTPFASP
jgi:hypothetical protein